MHARTETQTHTPKQTNKVGENILLLVHTLCHYHKYLWVVKNINIKLINV